VSASEKNLILWLQSWYLRRTNGDWEHSYGITIETLDNPGWRVLIDLSETHLAFKPFTPISYDNSPLDWLDCKVVDHRFEGHCGVPKLVTVLEVFKEWAEEGTGPADPL
jgi:immunity protein 53 of polymorphic toxin system